MRRVLSAILAFLSFVGLVTGLYSFFAPLIKGPDKPRPMYGDLNVASARFVASDEQSSATAADLSESVYDLLARDLAQAANRAASTDMLDIQVRGPRAVDAVQGSTPTEQHDDAKRVAGELNADIVLYGRLEVSPSGSRLTPQFYLDSRKLRDPDDGKPVLPAVTLAPPPSATVSLAAIVVPGDIESAIPSRARLRADLAARTRGLVLFAIGLGYYAAALKNPDLALPEQRRFDDAIGFLTAALRTGTWASGRAKAIVLLFLGNAAIKEGNLIAAERYFRRAVHTDPSFSRSHFGVAEVQYRKSAGRCETSSTVEQGVQEAINDYRSVLSNKSSSTSEILVHKAHFGLGRAYLCLTLAGLADRAHQAEQSLMRVIGAYERGYRPAKVLASESYGNIGVLRHVEASFTNTGRAERTRLAAAAEAYRSAIRLADARERQGLFFSLLGQIHTQLDQRAKAEADYQRAIELDPRHRGEYERQMQQPAGEP